MEYRLSARESMLSRLHGRTPNGVVVAVDGGDPRACLQADLAIVKARDLHVLRHAHAVLLQRLLHAHGKVIVCAEDHVGKVIPVLQHLEGCLRTLLHLPVCLVEARLFDKAHGAGIPICLCPRASLHGRHQPVDEGRTLATLLRQHLVDQAIHGLVVVRAHVMGALKLVVDGDHRLVECENLVCDALAHLRRPRTVSLDDEAVVVLGVAQAEDLAGTFLVLIACVTAKRVEDDELRARVLIQIRLHALVVFGHDHVVPVKREERGPLHACAPSPARPLP